MQRKYPVIENYFSIIDTDEKAYWLGFIAADGCVYKNTLRISLSCKDENHLNKLKMVLSPSRNLTYTKSKYSPTPLCNLEIKSKEIVEDLSKYGIVPNKTFILNCLPNLKKEYIHSYIRGYFDGDGSITIRRYKPNHFGALCISMLGNESFLNEIQSIFISLGCSKTKLSLAKSKTNSRTFQYSKGGNKQVRLLYNYLYQNATVYLKRKFLKFEALLGALDSDI